MCIRDSINPWDLQTALSQPGSVGPGATIYLRGGTYKGIFTSSLTGSAASPIVVKSFPGEWARTDGYRVYALTSALSTSTNSITFNDATGLATGMKVQVGNISPGSRSGVENILLLSK